MTDSAVLNKAAEKDTNKLRMEQAEFLLKALDNPIKVERIFRASEHNFKIAAFHERCDNKEDTLVLIRT